MRGMIQQDVQLNNKRTQHIFFRNKRALLGLVSVLPTAFGCCFLRTKTTTPSLLVGQHHYYNNLCNHPSALFTASSSSPSSSPQTSKTNKRKQLSSLSSEVITNLDPSSSPPLASHLQLLSPASSIDDISSPLNDPNNNNNKPDFSLHSSSTCSSRIIHNADSSSNRGKMTTATTTTTSINLMNDPMLLSQRRKYWVVLVDDEEEIRIAVGNFLRNCGYQVTTYNDAQSLLSLWPTTTTTSIDPHSSSVLSPPLLPAISSTKTISTTLSTSGGDATVVRTAPLAQQEQEPSSSRISSSIYHYVSPGGGTGQEMDDVSFITRRIPDVIVSDIRMPGRMDGLSLTREIRSNHRLIGIPVILLTAKGLIDDRIAGYLAGADSYITKPFDPEELVAIIDNVIERRNVLQQSISTRVDDLKQDINEIKALLLKKGGGGIGNGWVEATNVFLAPDEQEVLEQLCQGKTTKDIAATCYLSTRRVEQLLTRMFRKVNVKNRTELIRWAISTGNVQI